MTDKEQHKDFEHPMDIESFRKHAKDVVDYICDYYQNVEKQRVHSNVEPNYLSKYLPKEAPEKGEDFKNILKDIDKFIMPGVTHWQHPSFFAFFSANSSYPGMLGEMLSGMFNIIGFNWVCSPACTELEMHVMDWLAKALKLPDEFMSHGKGVGVIQGTASEAVLSTLLGSKAKAFDEWKMKYKDQPEIANNEDLFASKIVVYCSDQVHSSMRKACMIAGIPETRCHVITSNDDFEFDHEALKKAIQEDLKKELIPIFVCATIGTTSSTAIDDLTKLGPICKEFNVWLHVDAAFVGSSCICPEFRHYINGVEYATSFNFNPHKWMLTNFDCSALWVKNRYYLQKALSITPEYLRSKEAESGLVLDYRDLQIPLGRRFRSLKLWIVLRTYGISGIQEFIRHHIRLAKIFEELVKSDDRFELVTKRTSALVCFRLKGDNQLNKTLLDNLNASGSIYLTNTVLKEKFVLRFATCGTLTQEKHVRAAWKQIQEEATKLIG